MNPLTLILAAACAFMGGYILGISDIFKNGGEKAKNHTNILADNILDEEYRNFLSYDGTEQI